MGIDIANNPIINTRFYGALPSMCDFENNVDLIVSPDIAHWRDVDLSDIAVSVKVDDDIVGNR